MKTFKTIEDAMKAIKEAGLSFNQVEYRISDGMVTPLVRCSDLDEARYVCYELGFNSTSR